MGTDKRRMTGHAMQGACFTLAALAVALTGCAGTEPKLGAGGTVATGSAGGAAAQDASGQLERCAEPLGTIAVVEDQTSPWFRELTEYRLGSTVPVLRMMIQQSNCFVVVERGAAMNNMMQERALRSSGEMRAGSSYQGGQVAAADYSMNPSITFSKKGTGGAGAALGAFGLIGMIASVAAAGVSSNEASTTLLMIDNRSGVQLAAAVGSAQNYDFAGLGAAFGGSAAGGLGAYTKTPEGKVLVAAFMDSYNQIVKATRQYVAQNVRGGLGTGGALAVQGAQTAAISGGASNATAPTMSVADAQRKLAKLGYNPGPADGQMGGRTASALRAFQRDRNLGQTGQLDAPTIAELVK